MYVNIGHYKSSNMYICKNEGNGTGETYTPNENNTDFPPKETRQNKKYTKNIKSIQSGLQYHCTVHDCFINFPQNIDRSQTEKT